MGQNYQQEQVILDVISLPDDEAEDEHVNNGDDRGVDVENNGGGGGGDDQENAESETPSTDTQDDAAVEQNGNDGDAEMVVLADDSDGDGTSDKENIESDQQQMSVDDATVEPVAPAPVAPTAMVAPAPKDHSTPTPNGHSSPAQFAKPTPANALAQHNTNVIENGAPIIKAERKDCYWCEESFYKESSLINHMMSDHGMLVVDDGKKLKKKENDGQHDNEPGKYVRANKRKRYSLGASSTSSGIGSSTTSTENINDTENRDAQQLAKRKQAKSVFEPMRRSNPRV